ncbi:MAG TPA: protein-glutamate O-methyltransferase [Rhizomicrobium sp.]|jgi:chemotaxis protein methyltransferase CheR|nr:protein-glutamate O-methyltransferase [Rhizomicrobium sp.]
MNSTDFAFIAAFLKERSGLIITPDKIYLLETRLGAILREHALGDLTALADALRLPGPSKLKDKVVDAMTTNETSFFRDSHPFDTLKKSLIPGLIERRAAAKTLRIWSAACSTGQEPYSIAMTLKDSFPVLGAWKVEIIATDISPSVLDKAREGVYSTFEVQRGMPIQMLIRHFDQVEQNWRIKPELRQNIIFRSANLLDDFSLLGNFDIILCRNVLIYFDQPTKTRILNAMAKRMAPDGALLLGGAESVFGLCDAFQNLPGVKGVYGHATGQSLKHTAPIRPAAVA